MRTRDLVWTALLMALVYVATRAVQVPVPATGGYINLGDSMIYVAAFLFGPVPAALAGGIGAALADATTGFAAFAPFTLVIKALEGLVVGIVVGGRAARPAAGWAWAGRAIVAGAAGGAVMVAGYFAVEAFLMGRGVAAAATEIPGNVFQVVGGLVVALPVSALLSRALAPGR